MSLAKQNHRQSILIITISLSILLYIPSCIIQRDNLKFSEKTYIRDEDYNRTFNMLITDTDELSVAFQKELFTKDEMISITEKLISDVDLIQQIANETKSNTVQVYVLDSTITGYVQVTDNKVFCAEKDLAQPELQRALIQSFLKLSEPWVINGLQNTIFSDPPDQSVLSDYYSHNNDLRILSLFGAYFFPGFNDSYELSLAENTAASLTDFILANYDYQTLVAGVDPELKTEWLHHLGVDKAFEDPNKNDLQGFSFSRSEEYPVIISTKNSIYNLIYLEDELSSADDIQDFILSNIIGRRTVLSYLNERTSENKYMINNSAFYTYYLGDHAVNHSSARGEIELDNSTWAHLHEAVHVMIRPDKLMVFEGLANYLSMIIYSDPFIKEKIFEMFLTIQQQIDSGTIDRSDAEYKALQYYKESGGNVDSPKGIDLRLYCDTSAFINLNMEFGGPSERSPIYEIHRINESKRTQGDELSYMQACSFIAFILDDHDLDKVLSFGKANTSFHDIFGMTYDDAKNEWISYLEDRS